MKTKEEIFKLWKLGEPPFIESEVLLAMEQYASQFQSGEQLYREGWREKFEHWLTNNQWLNKEKAQHIIDHVERYIIGPQSPHKEEGKDEYNPELFEEAKKLIVKLLPPEEWGEDYNAERLYNIIEEMHGYAIKPQDFAAVSPSPGEQEAVEFAEWASDNDFVYTGEGQWFQDIPASTPGSRQTTQQLYNLFKQSLLSKEQNPETEK